MEWLKKLLVSFGYEGWAEYFASLFPSFKYEWMPTLVWSAAGLSALVVQLFGLDHLALIALLLAFGFELVTGIMRSRRQNEPFESWKLSRFSFKAAYYLLIISMTHLLSIALSNQGKALAADVMGWFYAFWLIEILFENVVSVLENLAVINGHEKTHWIFKIQERINQLLK